MEGKTVLITGATSGIGLEAARSLAAMGARVLLAGRDRARLDAALSAVRARGRDATGYVCDFSSQRSIRALANTILAEHARLDVLVNNAGGVNKTRQLTEDGIERTFATNHLGYFLLTTLLRDRLVASAPARVVTVASIGHRQGSLDFNDLGFEQNYSIMRAYCRSKLSNVLFANELARRLAGTGVTSNSLHPGSVATNIWSGAPAIYKPLIALLLRPFFISAAQGGQTIVQLAASPDLDGVTGRYFEKQRPVAPSARAQDAAVGRQLWAVSEELVNRSR